MLYNLLKSFATPDGNDDAIYHHAYELVAAMLGVPSAKVFGDACQYVDGKVYIPDDINPASLWRDMLQAAAE